MCWRFRVAGRSTAKVRNSPPSSPHTPAATNVMPRVLKKRAAIRTTTAYKTATATSLPVSLSATKMAMAAAAVATGRITVQDCPVSAIAASPQPLAFARSSELPGGRHFRSAVSIWPSGRTLLDKDVWPALLRWLCLRAPDISTLLPPRP